MKCNYSSDKEVKIVSKLLAFIPISLILDLANPRVTLLSAYIERGRERETDRYFIKV